MDLSLLEGVSVHDHLISEAWEEHSQDFFWRLVENGEDIDELNVGMRMPLARIVAQLKSLVRTLQNLSRSQHRRQRG